VLLKEIHHRVKNNLQVISSLLNLQSRFIKDKQSLDMFKESQSRIKAMALVHEKLYKSKDLARIDFAEYLRSLTDYLLGSYRIHLKPVTLKINAEKALLDVDSAITCGLIVSELVSNSLKHAFPSTWQGEESEIRIDLFAKDRTFSLLVSDNGAGFPQDLDFRNTESLGLQLVSTLTEQLEGAIELDRAGGTAFKIVFNT
jgi:two-component sensor histidine kinase